MVFQAGLYGMQSLLLDALPFAGGQLTALYADKLIYDVPGFPAILAQNLVDRLLEQAAVFQPQYHWKQPVHGLHFADAGWTVRGEQAAWRAPVLVLAAGIGAFAPKKPRAEAIDHYERQGQVIYDPILVRDWQGRHVLIQGATALAVATAVRAARGGARVTLVHRKDEFETLPQNAEAFAALRREGRIHCRIPYTVTALGGEESRLRQARLKGYGTADAEVETELFLPLMGFGASLGELKTWEIPLSKGSVEVAPASMESPKPQLYVIGDLAAYPGKIKLIVSAFGEAALAARHAFNYIYPDKRLPTAYSSSIGPLNLGKTRP